MGYCMELIENKFKIPAAKKDDALKAIKALAGKETYSDHFAWVTTKEFTSAALLEDGIRAWRWYPDTDEETGDVIGINFEGEKLGDDAVFFNAIAPFVEKGSYVEMQGEDGSRWRWVFDGKKMKEVYAKISWDDED